MPQTEMFEVPVDAECAGLLRAFELHVPNERGDWTQVNVTQNVAHDSYLLEFSAELLAMAPQGLTATVQLVMLELQRHRMGEVSDE